MSLELTKSCPFLVQPLACIKDKTCILLLRLQEGEYMAFGLSGDDSKSTMVGGDVTVAWMDQTTGTKNA